MQSTKVVKLKTKGNDLASRATARQIRQQINQHTTFDCEGVRTISHAFADELFAVLVNDNGIEWFRQKIKVVNATPEVRTMILSAITLRARTS